MDVDQPTTTVDKKGKGSADKKRFEVKKVCVLLYPGCLSSVVTFLNISNGLVERCFTLGVGYVVDSGSWIENKESSAERMPSAQISL